MERNRCQEDRGILEHEVRGYAVKTSLHKVHVLSCLAEMGKYALFCLPARIGPGRS